MVAADYSSLPRRSAHSSVSSFCFSGLATRVLFAFNFNFEVMKIRPG